MTKPAPLRPALFLDRDGTIIVEKDYLADPAQVELLPGAADALAALRDRGFALILVTNQSGIARGRFTEADFFAVQTALERKLAQLGVLFDGSYHCPHHPDFTGPCDCRKPGLALFLQAAENHRIDMAQSIWVGDRVSDVLPAARWGGRGFLVRTGYGREQEPNKPPGTTVLDSIADLPGVLQRSSPG